MEDVFTIETDVDEEENKLNEEENVFDSCHGSTATLEDTR